MNVYAGKTKSGDVWHVAVWVYVTADTVLQGNQAPLCSGNFTGLGELRLLTEVPAFGLCQRCERRGAQIAKAIEEVQS